MNSDGIEALKTANERNSWISNYPPLWKIQLKSERDESLLSLFQKRIAIYSITALTFEVFQLFSSIADVE